MDQNYLKIKEQISVLSRLSFLTEGDYQKIAKKIDEIRDNIPNSKEIRENLNQIIFDLNKAKVSGVITDDIFHTEKDKIINKILRDLNI